MSRSPWSWPRAVTNSLTRVTTASLARITTTSLARITMTSLALVTLAAAPAVAQHSHPHSPPRAAPDTARHARPAKPMPAAHVHGGMEHMGHAEKGETVPMRGLLGSYAGTREASGTAWQPDRAPHAGRHLMAGSWLVMLHGMADLVDDQQGGPRGAHRTFASNMLMATARRPWSRGRVGLRAMLSAEPATIGEQGYPLLLQTGETADGRTPLIDRQHPHDFFMELAVAGSVAADERSVFLYAALAGEPALGPPAFMHRASGAALPVAPLTHHWLDSSHITFGVLTGGVVMRWLKLEASAFRGREPDEQRWNLEAPKLDSHAIRVSANPGSEWALQASRGRLESPEQLEPDVDVDRTTVSVIREFQWRDAQGEATLAWGRNQSHPGRTLDAMLLEAAVGWGGATTLFGRLERVEKDELFPESDPRAHDVFDVGAWTLGFRYDFRRGGPLELGVGGAATFAQVPRGLRRVYGTSPTAGLLFLHAALH